jgi:hypothetical protein
MPKGGTPLDLYFAPEPYLSQVMALEPRPDPHTARVRARWHIKEMHVLIALDFV